MKFDLSGINQSFVNSAAVLEDLYRQREDTLRAVAQANQERIEREEKNGCRRGGEHCPKRTS